MKHFLCLIIGQICYHLERLDGEAWNLVKPDGEVYTVHRDQYGTHCTCGDANFRERKCKHQAALLELRVL